MKSILAIDDTKSNLTAYEALINNNFSDHLFLKALSGKEGIETAIKEQPDVILLDIVMPEMDGYQCCKRLKKDKLTKHIPIIMITAVKIDTQSRVKGLDSGADAFLSKPIDSSEFIAQVNVMLRIKEAEDKLRADKEILNEKFNKRSQELLESDNLLQSIFDDPDNFIGILELDGSFIRANNPALKFIDSTNSKLEGMKFWKTPWWDHSEELQKQLKKGIINANKGEITRFEATHFNKDNKHIFVDFSVRPVRDFQKKIFRLIVEGNDITKRKRTEQIQRVLHNITNAVTTTNNVEKIIYLIKDELGTLIDTKNYYIALYDEETDSLSLPFMADEKDKGIKSFPAGKTMTRYVIQTKKALLATDKQQEELVKKGKIKFVGSRSKIWLGVPLILNEKVIGVVAVQSYTDEDAYTKSDMELLEFISSQISISIDRKKTEEDLINALKNATESNRLKSAFLATMSHELRTPLNAIIGFSGIINEDLPIKDIVMFNKTINSSGVHLLKIIENVFDITLIEAGHINITKEDVKLSQLLKEVQDITKVEQQTINKNHLDLKIVIPVNESDLIINTDEVKLKQILLNLLKNALKFTLKGHVYCSYDIKTEQNKTHLMFFVEDTGIGIHGNNHEFIFDPFRKAEETDKNTFGGAGIGLSISKKMVELLGGKMWLKSKLGKGSTFYFSIPLEEAADEVITIEPQIVTKETKTKLGSKTILIAEDDESSFEFLKAVLTKSVSKIIWAKDGEEAIRICKENANIDLVLMDINMPIMNGFEATKAIKAFKPDLPIIVQTAFALIGDREKSLEAGCDDYISKPIKKEKLLSLIQQYFIK